MHSLPGIRYGPEAKTSNDSHSVDVTCINCFFFFFFFCLLLVLILYFAKLFRSSVWLSCAHHYAISLLIYIFHGLLLSQ